MKIIWIIIIIILIAIFICYFLFYRPLYNSDDIIEGNKQISADKLMIVAHPDDELIFGGKELIEQKGWKVICVTNGSNNSGNKFSLCKAEKRIKEFVSVMNELGCAYEMWDYEDNGFNSNWNEESLIKKLKNAINEKDYKMVLTHNLDGEYGHIQHKKISKLVHQINPKNLYVFGYVDKNADTMNAEKNPHIERLNQVLSFYSTQKSAVNDYYKNILYQSIKKVN